jgi:hypothetical protein
VSLRKRVPTCEFCVPTRAQVVFLVFENALENVFFQDMHAQLCCLLSHKAQNWCASFLKVRAVCCCGATSVRGSCSTLWPHTRFRLLYAPHPIHGRTCVV